MFRRLSSIAVCICSTLNSCSSCSWSGAKANLALSLGIRRSARRRHAAGGAEPARRPCCDWPTTPAQFFVGQGQRNWELLFGPEQCRRSAAGWWDQLGDRTGWTIRWRQSTSARQAIWASHKLLSVAEALATQRCHKSAGEPNSVLRHVLPWNTPGASGFRLFGLSNKRSWETKR
jgi:hypothetical protein